MAETTCPDCAVEMDHIERTTFTGRDMREYQCPKCGRKQIVDCGKALWQILSEANEESTKEYRRRCNMPTCHHRKGSPSP